MRVLTSKLRRLRPLAAVVLLTPGALAQTADWAALSGALGAAVPLDDAFGDAWRLEPGLAVRASTPAYGGTVRGSVLAFEAETTRDGLPGFLVVAPAVGWGVGVPLGRARAEAGAELGIVHMRFGDEGGFTGALQDETEVSVGLFGRVEARVVGPVSAWTDVSVARVALAEPVALTSVAAGLSVSVATPGWLRRALR